MSNEQNAETPAASAVGSSVGLGDNFPDLSRLQTWFVVFRRGDPIAAFPWKKLAEEWLLEAEHRREDTIAARKILFRGIDGYSDAKIEPVRLT